MQKNIAGILAHVFVKIVKYLKHIADDSKIVCDEIINATDSVSTNFDNKKVRYKMDYKWMYYKWMIYKLNEYIQFY